MKKVLIAAICAAGFAVPASASSLTETYSAFYSLGDSLTDDGKFGVLDPPSFEGRFTNGLTWSEYIEDDFAAVGLDAANFALGGATAGPVNIFNPGPLATLDRQIAALMGALPGLTPGDNPLVSLWFGANDIFQGFVPEDAANSVLAGVRAIGGIPNQNFDDFLIVQLPDVPNEPGAAQAFNTQLASNISTLTGEGFNITTYDPANATNAIVTDFFNGSPIYGITDLVTPCTDSLRNGDPASCLDDNVDPNTRLFVDAVHPNAVAHQLVAEQINATFDMAAVPLPAGLPLILIGMGALAMVRRRAA